MANIETNVADYFETTLASTLSSGASSAVVSSESGSPAVPFYMVVDADDSSNFWVAKVTAKAGTTFTLESAAPRTFNAGTEVGCYPVAALWTDINDRVDSHTHSGGTDGTAVATSSLTGHHKAAHDALAINADTVDSQHASDLLSRANHTGTQTVSTLSDHNDTTHVNYRRVLAVARITAPVDIATAAATAIDADTEVVDSDSALTLTPLTFTVPAGMNAHWWQVHVDMVVAQVDGGSGEVRVNVKVGGVTQRNWSWAYSGTAGTARSKSVYLQLDEDDAVTIGVEAVSGPPSDDQVVTGEVSFQRVF